MTSDPEDPVNRPSEPQAAAESSTPSNAAERVIERFGGIRPMAAKLEVPVTTVQGWKKRGVIPAQRHNDIRAAATRHGVPIDAAELAASDPDEGPTGATAAAPPHGGSDRLTAHSAAPAKRADGVGVAVAASLIAVIAAIAAATAPLWSQRLFPALRGGTADVMREVEALNGRLDALEQRRPQDPTARVAALEQAVSAVRASVEALPRDAGTSPPDPALTERLAKVDQQLQSLAASAAAGPALADRVGRLEQRFDAVLNQTRELQASVGQAGVTAQSLPALAGTVKELQASADEFRRTLAAIQKRQEETTAGAKQAQQQELRTHAAILALSQLRMALQGAQPFAGELATVRTVAGTPVEAAAGTLDRISPFADAGAPTRAQLRERFEAVARAVLQPEQATASGSWTDQTLNRVTSLVTIRRQAGEAAGNSASAIVARAEARLQADDLTGAIEALSGLTGKAAETASPWVQQARARLALDQAAAEIARIAIAGIGADVRPAQ
jgi:hypothetical protein